MKKEREKGRKERMNKKQQSDLQCDLFEGLAQEVA